MGRGLRPRILASTKGNSIGGGQAFLVIERGAALSNTRGKRNELRDSLYDCRESTKGKRGESEIEETEDVTWGPGDPQVLLKYEEIKGIALKGMGV